MTTPPARGNESNGLEAGWGSHYVRARGTLVIVILALLVMGLAVVYANFQIAGINIQGFDRIDKELKELTTLTRAQDHAFAARGKEHEIILEAVETMIYVLTLTPEERAKLRLERPRYLRHLERRGTP